MAIVDAETRTEPGRVERLTDARRPAEAPERTDDVLDAQGFQNRKQLTKTLDRSKAPRPLGLDA